MESSLKQIGLEEAIIEINIGGIWLQCRAMESDVTVPSELVVNDCIDLPGIRIRGLNSENVRDKNAKIIIERLYNAYILLMHLYKGR
jgi:hypothetical protein